MEQVVDSTYYRSEAGARAVHQAYLELLDGWPVPCERFHVPTRQGDTFVVACGPKDAPPVLALQGSSATAAMWLPQIGEWARQLRIYAVDVIGEPGMSAATRPALDDETHAQWLDDVVRELGLERVALVGVSFGGWLALDYASRRPERVTRLAVLCPSGIGRIRLGTLFKVALLAPFGESARRKAMAAVLLPAGQKALPSEQVPAGERKWDRAIGEFATIVFQHFKPRMGSIPTFDDDALRRLTMPILAVVGARDALIDSYRTRERLEATAPQAMVRMLPDAGHLLPDQATPILEFLHDAE